MIITSPHNQHLKEIRKLRTSRKERERSRRFIAEGEDLLDAADARGWEPVHRFCAAGSGLAGVEVEPELLARASGLASGTRALGVYTERWVQAPAGPLCVSLHGVRDPGNVGTILRSAHAFGAASVAIDPGTADPYGPEAVRASMGAIFSVPVARVHDLSQLPSPTVALVPHGGGALNEFPLDRATLLIGGERDGLPQEIVQRASYVAHIPIANHSLNAAMAATIALYEATRRMASR